MENPSNSLLQLHKNKSSCKTCLTQLWLGEEEMDGATKVMCVSFPLEVRPGWCSVFSTNITLLLASFVDHCDAPFILS